jgi:hypothetical protein
MPPCAVPLPTFELVQNVAAALLFLGAGSKGEMLPAVLVAAVPLAAWVTEQFTEQYTTICSIKTSVPLVAGCCTVAAVPEVIETSPVVAL